MTNSRLFQHPVSIAVFFLLACVPALASETISVEKIEMEGLYSISRQELLYLLDIEPGRTVRPEDVTAGIRRAFLKGIFEDVSVESDDEKPGLLRVKVREKEKVGKIIIRGNEALSGKFIRRNLGISEGGFVRADTLQSLAEDLRRTLGEKGFPSAEVEVRVEKTSRPYMVNAIVEIKEGRPVVIREVVVIAPAPNEVRTLMRLREGGTYDQYRLREDIERIKKRYKDRGHLNPAVGPYTFKDGTLHLNVEPGLKLEITIKGNKAISSRTLRRVLPFYEIGEVGEDLIEEASSKIASLYRAEGYPFVQIAPLVSKDGDLMVLSFYIYEGERVRVGSVEFTGATIAAGRLKSVMTLREGGPYNPDRLAMDAETLGEFYYALGYMDAEIDEPKVSIRDSRAHIVMDVSEGPGYEIAGVGVEGVESVPDTEVFAALRIRAGIPYNEVDIADTRRRLMGACRGRGFPSCKVEVSREFDGTAVSVRFRVNEGRRQYFGKTVIAGNYATNYRVIGRELLYKEDMPFDEALLLKARPRLYKVGLFTDVELKTVETRGDAADVVVKVKEGNPGVFEFGLGYGEYERYRGFFDVSYKNLWGMNRQASFRTELSTLESRYILSYHEPWFLRKRIPMRAFLVREERKEKNIDTGDVRYRIKRHSASLGVQKKLSEKVRLDLLYEFSLTETFDVKPDVILSKDDTGTLIISSVTPSISYDARDDPFDPQRGVFAGLSVKTASAVLLSESDFVKLTAHGSGYLRIFRWLVAAASLRGGTSFGYAGTEELPIVERFFLGGRNTVRGFDQDSIGPAGVLGTPIGGNVFALGNLELRVRLSKGWRVVGFLDAGNVWPRAGDADPEDLRYTAGGGIRYGTPVGPIRVDYGHKLDRKPGESGSEIHFSIGHAF